MTKNFVCKIDNHAFPSKEELIEHMLKTHAFDEDSDGELQEVHGKLQEAFPFATIHVTNTNDDRYGPYQVEMNWEEDDAEFRFYVGTHTETDYYDSSYTHVEDAIQTYLTFKERKDEIIQKVTERYGFDSVSVTQMYEGDYNNNSGISFEAKKGEQSYFASYEFERVDDFVASFTGFFDKKFEGDVRYDIEAYVGPVPLKRILERAKKIRIEIVEEK